MAGKKGTSRLVSSRPARPRGRADAQRNLESLLCAAKALFASRGVDASMRDIAHRAGVGVGTLYRHFPQRGDLVTAVFHREMDSCAESAARLAAARPPFEALALWMQQFTALAVTKRGLAAALHSVDPAHDGLPARRDRVIRPAFLNLFETAVKAGEIRADVDPDEILDAVASLCIGAYDTRLDYAQRMVALFVSALRSCDLARDRIEPKSARQSSTLPKGPRSVR